MTKITSFIITLLMLYVGISSTNAYFYNESYYIQSIERFIKSPSVNDLIKINNNRIRNCERVYLEATRRRKYTDIEINICNDIFKVKIQEELDYKTFMLRGRGIK